MKFVMVMFFAFSSLSLFAAETRILACKSDVRDQLKVKLNRVLGRKLVEEVKKVGVEVDERTVELLNYSTVDSCPACYESTISFKTIKGTSLKASSRGFAACERVVAFDTEGNILSDGSHIMYSQPTSPSNLRGSNVLKNEATEYTKELPLFGNVEVKL